MAAQANIVLVGFLQRQSQDVDRPHAGKTTISWGACLQEICSNHYIYGQDGRVQHFAFIPEEDIGEEEAPGTSQVMGAQSQVRHSSLRFLSVSPTRLTLLQFGVQ